MIKITIIGTTAEQRQKIFANNFHCDLVSVPCGEFESCSDCFTKVVEFKDNVEEKND